MNEEDKFGPLSNLKRRYCVELGVDVWVVTSVAAGSTLDVSHVRAEVSMPKLIVPGAGLTRKKKHGV